MIKESGEQQKAHSKVTFWAARRPTSLCLKGARTHDAHRYVDKGRSGLEAWTLRKASHHVNVK